MSTPRVAILGATGHVGMVLTAGLSSTGCEIAAFARSPERLEPLIAELRGRAGVRACEMGTFGRERFDAVVNATGIGDPAKFGPGARDLRGVTEHFDAEVLTYLERFPSTRAIGISSGAVYLSTFDGPADSLTPVRPPSAEASASDVYGALKAASEARHRAAADMAIVDLRLFGLFSPYVDLNAGFLLSQAIRCLRDRQPLDTDDAEIVRDYAHPHDLTALVRAVIDAPPANQAYDVYSRAPASKTEILRALSEGFGLSYSIGAISHASTTGRKPCYYTTNRTAASLGYEPRFTTLTCVADVAASLIERWKDADR